MKLNKSLLLTLLLVITLDPPEALPQSATATVAGRVVGYQMRVSSFQVALASDHTPCSFLQTHTTADGSFRFSSVRSGDYRVAVSGLPEGYGIKAITADGLDLLFNSVRLVSSIQTQVLIEVARVEDLRRQKSSVVRVGDDLRSFCVIHKVKPVYPTQAKAAHIVGSVILSIRFDENGNVNDVRVIEKPPVRQWRYVPFVFHKTIIP